jgi:acyl-CoA synthetase (AMP-forming)/AMP-acid ligase II
VNAAALLQRLGDLHPASPALLDEGGARNWAETRERVARLAGALRGLGADAGDRVALLALNEPRCLEAHLAVAWLGAVVVPLNARLSPAEIRFQIMDAGAGLCLVGQALRSLAREAVPDLPRVVLGAAAADAGERASEALLARAEPVRAPVALAGNETLGIFYTGGTTGIPKGVMLSHDNLLANAANMAPAVGYGGEDVHLHVAPLFHLADLGSTWAALTVGSAHAFLPAFRAESVLAAVERYRATVTLLVPAMVTSILRSPELGRHDLASWRLLHYGGAPIAEDALARALERLPCGLMQGYGQTEATQTICLMGPDAHRRAAARPALLRACGVPIAGVQVRVVDGADRPARPGEVGEVVVRGPTVMQGYWNRPGETAEALRGGWLRTGDLATTDEEGFLYLLDRKKDMIVSGGENVFSAEVESALAHHPAVLDAAVIGVPDEVWGERVHAVVVLVPGRPTTPDELREHCRGFIGGFKVPRSFEFRESLPRTATGKIQKAVLREAHWVGRARRI